MSHSVKIKNVYPKDNMFLLVEFENDIFKLYDMKQLIPQFEIYKELENPDIFNLVYVDCGGCGVAWTDEIDVSEVELWENGTEIKSPFGCFLSFSEAAEKWGLDDSTLRYAVRNKKLIEGIDVKKFGKQWVITEQSMIEHFGESAKI